MSIIGNNTGSIDPKVYTAPAPTRPATTRPATQTTTSEATADAAPAAPQSPTVETLPNGTLTRTETGAIINAKSGLTLTVDGNQQSIEIPGQGAITHTPDGITGPGGVAVEPHTSETGDITGYSYAKADGSHVYVDLGEMSYGFQSKDGDVVQSVDSDGGQYIRVNNSFSPDQGKSVQNIVKEVYVEPNGDIHTNGEVDGLNVSQNSIKFKNPMGATVSHDLVVPTYAAPASAQSAQIDAPVVKDFNPKAGSLLNADPGVTSATGPILAEDPAISQAAPTAAAQGVPVFPGGPTNEEIGANVSLIGAVREAAANPGTQFDGNVQALQNGSLRIQSGEREITYLANDLALCHNTQTGQAFSLDIADGSVGAASVTPIVNQNGEQENKFDFADPAGNRYTTYSKSQEIVAETPQGLGQVVLADGTKFIALKGGQSAMSMGPNGEISRRNLEPSQSDPSMGGWADSVKTTVNGQDQFFKLPIPLNGPQMNSSLWSALTVDPKLVSTGAALPSSVRDAAAFQPEPAPAAAAAPGPQPFAGATNLPPIPPEGNPNPGGDNGTVFPEPGRIQQGFKPSIMNRLKFLWTGNQDFLQPREPMVGSRPQMDPNGAYMPGQRPPFPGYDPTGGAGGMPPIPPGMDPTMGGFPPLGGGMPGMPGMPGLGGFPGGTWGCDQSGQQQKWMKAMMVSSQIGTTSSMIMAMMSTFTSMMPFGGMSFMTPMMMF